MRNTYLPYARQNIDDEDVAAVVNVLKGDWITTGPCVDEFERAVCAYVGAKFGVAVNSGTSGLDIAVASLELKGEIITTPFTFAASSNAILFNGLKPVFADIKKDTYNIDPEEIRKRLTKRTKAIIYVDYAGQPCDLEEIKEIAEKHDLYTIEDAAHALGAEYRGTKVGNFADITMFSFHPVKHITTGEGGMCVTENEGLAEKMEMLRNHGIDRDTKSRYGPDATWAYDIKYLGRNYRLTDFQSVLGISQLKKIENSIRRRKEIAEGYNKLLNEIPEVETPYVKPDVRHAWHLYPILLNGVDRDKFFVEMRRRNIGVNVHYIPIYRHSYYKFLNINPKVYSSTEWVFHRIISLPMFPAMEDHDIIDVVEETKEVIKELKMEKY
jgi:UDP-4-amino-4,6-dideoxy-N-acetyl-beta-L-altrosamine transaminase